MPERTRWKSIVNLLPVLVIFAFGLAQIDASAGGLKPLGSEWVDLNTGLASAEPDVYVLDSSNTRTLINVDLPGFWKMPAEASGQSFHALEIPGHNSTLDIGKPEMPVIRVLIAVPGDAAVHASFEATKQMAFEGIRVYPCQEPEVDGAGPKPAFTMDDDAYASATPYPGFRAKVGEPAIWRHLRVVSVEIAPMDYIASEERLVVYPSMTVELTYTAGGTINVLNGTQGPVRDHWKKMYANNILNFDWVDLDEGNRSVAAAGPAYFVIAYADFAPAVQPLVDWHQKAGLATEMITVTSTNSTAVKNEITARYNQGNLEYVLLVGDTYYMPVYYWDGHISDHWYACITGGGAPDAFADIAVGRLSATTATKIGNHVTKILNYTKDPPLDDWLKKFAFVAHKEDAPDKYVGCKNHISTYIVPQPPYVVDKYYGHKPEGINANVKAAINEGRGIVNYRGHGSNTAWAGWNYYNGSWTNTNVNALTNGDRTPVVFNIACGNHKLTANCLGETWLNKYPGGGVASIGSSDESLTDVNHTYDKHLFEAICNIGIHKMGPLLVSASDEIIANHGGMGKTNSKMYLLLGDPAMEIWTDIPIDLAASHPTDIATGSQSIDVTVTHNSSPVADVLVCLYKADDVFETATTAANGIASFSIAPGDGGILYVTATKHDCLPYEGEIQVAAGEPLTCDTYTIPEATGGTVNFFLAAGTGNAGRNYIILGGTSGTSPGFPLPGGYATLPLNWDWFTDIVFSLVNSLLFNNFMGSLDGSGMATAQLNFPPVPGYAGTVMYYAFTCSNPFDYVSNPVTITIQ
jgi:gingipain R